MQPRMLSGGRRVALGIGFEPALNLALWVSIQVNEQEMRPVCQPRDASEKGEFRTTTVTQKYSRTQNSNP
jgi:hypothetical protein